MAAADGNGAVKMTSGNYEYMLTRKQIDDSDIASLARETWLKDQACTSSISSSTPVSSLDDVPPSCGTTKTKFNGKLVKQLYDKIRTQSETARIPLDVVLLELFQYLELYLWPNYPCDDFVQDKYEYQLEHTMSIIVMVNEKNRESVNGLEALTGNDLELEENSQKEKKFDRLAAHVMYLLVGKMSPQRMRICSDEEKNHHSEDDRDVRVLTMREKTSLIQFVRCCFNALENDVVRKTFIKTVSLNVYHMLSPEKLELELYGFVSSTAEDEINEQQQLQKQWKLLAKRATKRKLPPPLERIEVTFMSDIITQFLQTVSDVVVELETIDNVEKERKYLPRGQYNNRNVEEDDDKQEMNGITHTARDDVELLFCENFVAFLVNIMSQLPTRRFVMALLQDKAVLVKLHMLHFERFSELYRLHQLTMDLAHYIEFPINNITMQQLNPEQVESMKYSHILRFMKLCFKYWPQMKDLSLGSVRKILGDERKTDESYSILKKSLLKLNHEELYRLCCTQLRLVNKNDSMTSNDDFLRNVIVNDVGPCISNRRGMLNIPIYPTEEILYDEDLVPSMHYRGDTVLPLPQLNLQFLSFKDYLLRNYTLFRLEAACDIRDSVSDAVKRLQPFYSYDMNDISESDEATIKFQGWSRMALPLKHFAVTEVARPKVGTVMPGHVKAEARINLLDCRMTKASEEWDQLREHDNVFLLTLRPPTKELSNNEILAAGEELRAVDSRKAYGLVTVRGAEITEIRDAKGRTFNDFSRDKSGNIRTPEGTQRTLILDLDSTQYQNDVDRLDNDASGNEEDIYSTFNIILRRHAKENNFKAVLSCIRDLIASNDNELSNECSLPDWLQDIFLGYGDPNALNGSNTDNEDYVSLDLKDTLINEDHVRESFPGRNIEIRNNVKGKALRVFYKVRIPINLENNSGGKKRKVNGDVNEGCESTKPIIAEAYLPKTLGPYEDENKRSNKIRFTSVQVKAMCRSLQSGLTMIVGPPGTGKTDVAVQILHLLYHCAPNERTLIITHSNSALNDIFEKLSFCDIPSRYLLRLGMGEQDLMTSLDFSREGRINAQLQRRLNLLAEVERLAKSIDVADDVAYTCETSANFFVTHIKVMWDTFLTKTKDDSCQAQDIITLFPFKTFFQDLNELITSQSKDDNLKEASNCFEHLRLLFDELEECRPFELLISSKDRGNYLLTRQAKVVAMTCTHAALKRHEFIDIGFKYDNVVMEEAAQILEIETFIPFTLQKHDDNICRLKRVIMIGDHNQLPPVVKNTALGKYAHMDQSLFARFVRLRVPQILLNLQGRARPSIAKLYNWRYGNQLGDLSHVSSDEDYLRANAGFAHEFQFIDVSDYGGKGETVPTPYFFQNLGEAEYIVSVYQYMRLLGYPASSISVITTYKGQKHLLRDVFNARCANHPAFGLPKKVTTVDKYQGQQNDYILLSLVRTRHVGHIRDVRRLVVALSRARKGLYIFGRVSLFNQCHEILNSMKLLLKYPTKLALLANEPYPTSRRPLESKVSSENTKKITPYFVDSPDTMHTIVLQMTDHWETLHLGLQQTQQN